MRAFARPSSLDTGWHGLTLSPPRTAFGKELLIEANETKKSLPSLPLFPSVQGIRAGADEGFWNRSTRRAQSLFSVSGSTELAEVSAVSCLKTLHPFRVWMRRRKRSRRIRLGWGSSRSWRLMRRRKCAGRNPRLTKADNIVAGPATETDLQGDLMEVSADRFSIAEGKHGC